MGFHIAMYATFVAAIVTATVQAARRDGGPVLTGMLVWSGIFGLGASSYYVGRSDVLNLIALFSAWCFALLLLTVVVVRSLAGARARRPTVADVAVLFGCGLAACAIVQVPLPWTQISRLRQAAPAIFKQTTATRFVARTTTPGEKVAILIPLGHRVAFDAGVVDVAPYSGSESIPTVNQMQTTLEAMRSAAVERVYVDKAIAYPGQFRALVRAGWVTTGRDGRYVMLTKVPPSS
jgi:FAD/FMN-containing dehydrogenase